MEESRDPSAENLREHPASLPASPSGSDSSSDEESRASTRPNKRERSLHDDPRIDALMNQVGFLTNILQSGNHIDRCTPFLINPTTEILPSLDLGKIETIVDKSKVTRPASNENLARIKELQHFGSLSYKEVKYSKTLQRFSATPAFVELKINEELHHFNKTKDYLAGTENLMAGLSNALINQESCLRAELQAVIDWAHSNPGDLNVNSLVEQFTKRFGNESEYKNNASDILQVVCGKRAECIEIRRERVLHEIHSKTLQEKIRELPPSMEYLFDKNNLTGLIQSLGGPQLWLHPPTFLKEKEKRHVPKRKEPEPGPSRTWDQTESSYGNSAKRFKPNQNQKNDFHGGKKDYKGKGKGKGKGKKPFRSSK